MVQNTAPAIQQKRKRSKQERKNTRTAYIFLAPNFLGFVIFTLVPVVFSIHWHF